MRHTSGLVFGPSVAGVHQSSLEMPYAQNAPHAGAYRRGARLCGGDRHLVGLGCTCALASQPPKRGEHRCHVATFGARGFAEYHLTMEKGRRDRWEEDGLASALVVQALADAAAEAEADGDSDARHETHHQQQL